MKVRLNQRSRRGRRRRAGIGGGGGGGGGAALSVSYVGNDWAHTSGDSTLSLPAHDDGTLVVVHTHYQGNVAPGSATGATTIATVGDAGSYYAARLWYIWVDAADTTITLTGAAAGDDYRHDLAALFANADPLDPIEDYNLGLGPMVGGGFTGADLVAAGSGRAGFSSGFQLTNGAFSQTGWTTFRTISETSGRTTRGVGAYAEELGSGNVTPCTLIGDSGTWANHVTLADILIKPA